MDDPQASPPRPEDEIDWDDVCARMLECVRRESPPWLRSKAEDLAQEGMIGVLRVTRRENVQNLGGLVRVIAKRTVIDAIRTWRRYEGRVDPGADIDRIPNHDEGPEFGDPAQIMAFVLLEFFRQSGSPCHRLGVLHHVQGYDWKEVGATVGKSADAVKQQWSRCVKAFLEERKRRSGTEQDGIDG